MNKLLLLGAAAMAAAFMLGRKAADGTSQESSPAPPKKPRKGRVLLVGDSLMVGAAPFVESPKLLVAKEGRTLAEMLSTVKDLPAEGFTAIVVNGGLNDLAGGASSESVLNSMRAIWNVARSKGWAIYQNTLTPFGGGIYASSSLKSAEPRRVQINDALTSGPGDVTAIPMHVTLADVNDTSRLASVLAAPDRLHLNAKGYKLMGGIIDEAIAGSVT